MAKAVFLDRDGVINELVYYEEHSIIDSPFTVAQFKLLPGVPEAIKLLRQAGYLVVLVSNQPGIAKGYMSPESFEMIKRKMESTLDKAGAPLDGEYYCLHHPEAVVERFRVQCKCRKPKPGLLLQASRDMDIDLRQSWFVGDNLSDIKAGESAHCRTILLTKMKCEMCQLMSEQNVSPDKISPNLPEAVRHILDSRSTIGNLGDSSDNIEARELPGTTLVSENIRR